MHNLFFLGIILVERKKFRTKGKNNTKPKKIQSITFCCGDCRNKHGYALLELRGGPCRAASGRTTKGKEKG